MIELIPAMLRPTFMQPVGALLYVPVLHDRLRHYMATGPTANLCQQLRQLLDEAVQSTRTLLCGLGPPPLAEKQDLLAALNWVVEMMRRHRPVVTLQSRERTVGSALRIFKNGLAHSVGR